MALTGRPREFDREEALDAAMRLFWRKGFQSTSMNDLCEAMHIRSPSLYAAFGSKEALYLESMSRYGRIVGSELWDRVETAPTARVGVETMLLSAADMLSGSSGTPQGCMAMLAAVSDEWPHPVREAAKAMRDSSLARLQARMKRALEEGELPTTTDTGQLARLYFAIFQGMAVQAKDGIARAELAKIAAGAMAAWPDRPMLKDQAAA